MEYVLRPVKEPDLPEPLGLTQCHADYEQSPFLSGGKTENLKIAVFDHPARLFCEIVAHKGKLTGLYSYTFDFSIWDANEFMYLDCLF